MTPLTGTDKQIAWAESIRAKVMAEVAAARVAITQIEPKATGNLPAMAAISLARDAMAALETKTAAGWWIDNAKQLGILAGLDLVSASDPAIHRNAERLLATGIK